MKHILLIILSVIVLTGCQEVFMPEVETIEPILYIECMFTSLPANHLVKIYYTRTFNERPYYPFVDDAIVEIEDTEGNIIPFYYRGSGIYICDSNNTYMAEVGESYVLRVSTSDGEVFESSPQTVRECPEISNLFCKYDQEVHLNQNSNNDVFEVQSDGIQIISETQGISPIQNYYFYRWIGYEQHVNAISTLSGESTYYIYRHRRIKTKYRQIIRTGNADRFLDFKIKNLKMVFISTEDMSNYIQPFSDTMFVLDDNWFEGLLFKLEQLSISDNAYSFWRDAEIQLEAEGRLFDPVASQLKGNFKCITDSTKNVIGIFNASDVSEKYAYFYINSENITTSIDIDGFPTLYLDTCSWGRPDDWIRRP